MLTQREFAEYVRDHVKEHLPASYADASVDIHEVTKANDVVNTGIVIKNECDGPCPIIYIDGMYQEYRTMGESLDRAVGRVAKLYLDNADRDDVGVAAHKALDYENVKPYLIGRLVDPQTNSKFVERFVLRPIGELALTYQIDASALSSSQVGLDTRMIIRVTKTLLDKWGITEDVLFRDMITAERAREAGLFGLVDVITCGGRLPDRNLLKEETLPELNEGIPVFYVLTYRDGRFGASLLAHDDVLKKVSECIGGGYYIVPSSIHELLVIRDDTVEASVLMKMCHDVNTAEVSAEERLSDRVQHYDAETGNIENAVLWENRIKK